MAIASLVLGILSLILMWIPGINIAAMVLGIAGAVLGALSLKHPTSGGLAMGGMIMSIVGLALSLVIFFACGGCYICAAAQLASQIGY